MRKFLLVVALLSLPIVALGQMYGSWSESQILTRAAPTLTTEGISLAGVSSYRVLVSAQAAATVTGGALTCYYFSAVTSRWGPCATSLNWTPATGGRDAVSADFSVGVPAGRVLYATNAVTVSAGTTVTVAIELTKYAGSP